MTDTTKQLRARANMVYIVMVLFALAISVRLFTIQLVEGEEWRAKAEHVATTYRTVQPDRGHIYSEDGRLLATSVPEYDVRMDMIPDGLSEEMFSSKVDSLAIRLSQLFGDRTAVEYKRDLVDARKRKERYHLVKRRADHAQVQQLREFPIFNLGRYRGGLVTEKRTVRVHPFGRLGERTVGYMLRDSTTIGLENGYDQYLKGVTGRRLERRLTGGVWMPIDDGEGVDPVEGSDIHTTIDINLQDVADDALEQQLLKHGAVYGCVIVMEVATGYIKAASNLMLYKDSTYSEAQNFAVGESTEPGSTFKLASLMVGLEDGLIASTDTVDTQKGAVRFRDRIMRDSHEGGYGKITVQRAFELSSNTGISVAVNRAYEKDPKRFVDGLRRMGLDLPTGVLVPGEPRPTMRNPGEKGWSGVSLPWMSIGYEVSLTPLQTLTFYNAVANNGRMMKPRFVSHITRNGKVTSTFEPQVINERIASDKTLDIVQGMLQGVVDSGTATNLRAAHFAIAGKTGTAQIARNGSYKQHGVSYQASFVGYFPADAPKYSCIVVVNGPTMSGYYGNVVAGPIFKEIADKIYSNRLELQQGVHLAKAKGPSSPISLSGNSADLRTAMEALKVPMVFDTESEWVTTQAGDSSVTLVSRGIPTGAMDLVPNVLGMGLKDAIYILENRGLRVRFEGSGMVKRQSLPPGTKATSGSMIVIELT
ncbi:MAG: transpeptidase family protein [Flavobacteriales bacterium]|nr:transpeptidase family protein [Flavobacteriales bacterium]MBK6943819.1 transpeptidase family protein [Flavobacteriales bacterium]MBK7240029.1 transpeptidase family protein [Flavobacteriales bacterium]MBK7297078.1 transpeptidase family protein [Flavobacteriales bacterium]MBP9138647.1 transpeptidase family protein [Flavobacteriales bacterium]